jgi:hypothetical protein
MKNTLGLVLFLAILSSCTAGNEASTTSRGDDKASSVPIADSAKGKYLQDIRELSEVHKFLASATGTWIAEEIYKNSDTAAPITRRGFCENKMILNGHWLQSTYTYKNENSDTPFVALGLLGYDNNKKVIESSWQDNETTGMVYLEGTLDTATKTITLKGHYDDSYGRSELKQVYSFIDDRHVEMRFYGSHPKSTKEENFIEVKMTRK